MHILSIPSWYSHDKAPLLGSFFKEQAEGLVEHGMKVGVLAGRFFDLPSNDWKTNKSTKISIHQESTLTVVRCQKRLWSPGPLHRISFFYNLTVKKRKKTAIKMYDLYVLENGVPDIIHSQSALWGGVMGEAISLKHNIPHIITEHSSVIPREIAGPRERNTAKQVFLSADRTLSISKSLTEDLHKTLNIFGIQFNISPHMVSDQFKFSKNIKNSKFQWLSVGNLVEGKGYHHLLKSFSLHTNLDSELTIIGGGPFRQELEDLSIELGIDGRVHFLGLIPREQIPNYFEKCNAYVHPSKYETQGIVIIEALAVGRPVLSTRCGGPNEARVISAFRERATPAPVATSPSTEEE